jgi:tetratricopeptide (TPR) repeat protein
MLRRKTVIFTENIRKNILFILLSAYVATLASCQSSQVKGSGGRMDPFPGEILNHKVFKVFRSENRLGYTFRDERRQLFGDQFWEGQEATTRGEDKVISYSVGQSAALSTRFPVIGAVNLRGGVENVSGFRVILKGLRVHELKRPFVVPEYKNEPEVKTTDYIISMLSADKIVIQVFDAKGATIGGGVSFIFTGDVKFSRRQSGAVAAENVFLGYIMTKPTRRDLARRANTGILHKKGTDIIKLAVFHPDDRTGDSNLKWLPDSLQNKLEEAFLRLPQFYVVTRRKEDARYKLKGIIKKIGHNAEIRLALYDSHKNIQLQVHSELIRFNNVDQLYRYQLTVVKKFIEPLGVSLNKKQSDNVKKAVDAGSNIDLVKLVRKGWRAYNSQKYRRAESIGNQVYKQDRFYSDGLNLLARTKQKLGMYDEAIDYAQQMGSVARKKNDQILLAKSYNRVGNIYRFKRQYSNAIVNMKKAVNIRNSELGPNHKSSIYANQGLALAYSGTKKNWETKEAIRIYLDSVEKLKKILGAEHKSIGTTYLSIGAVYSRAKKYESSLDYLFRALAIQKKKLKNDHPDIANSYRWIGSSYYYMKNYRSAERYYLDAKNIYERLFGSGHPDTKGTYGWLASIYKKMGNTKKAAYYRRKKNR